jgi:hypothetical protein
MIAAKAVLDVFGPHRRISIETGFWEKVGGNHRCPRSGINSAPMGDQEGNCPSGASRPETKTSTCGARAIAESKDDSPLIAFSGA